MEHEWMQSLSDEVKEHFCAARYMDDILMFVKETPNFNCDKFLQDFEQSECYLDPLALEDGKDNTFLESTFHLNDKNGCTYWLKNENVAGQPPKIWRYAHFYSHGALIQKIRVLKATLHKLYKMASNDDILASSAIQKLYEFLALKYPAKIIASACNTMATTTRNPTWFRIRNSVIQQIPARF